VASPVNGIVKPALMPIEASPGNPLKRAHGRPQALILKLIRHAQRRPEDDPSNTQTADTISAHYRNAKVGDIAVVRETYGGSLNFRLTKINAIKGPRVYLAYEPLYMAARRSTLRAGKTVAALPGRSTSSSRRRLSSTSPPPIPTARRSVAAWPIFRIARGLGFDRS
jgi:hypothetical protein